MKYLVSHHASHRFNNNMPQELIIEIKYCEEVYGSAIIMDQHTVNIINPLNNHKIHKSM